jgi:hypothetical protein
LNCPIELHEPGAVAVCFSIPPVTQKTSAATTATCRPGLMTRARSSRAERPKFVFASAGVC